MGTGEISWPDKLIVLPFSAERPAPQQETDKGKARGATLRRTASYHKELLIHLHKHGGIAQICNHTARRHEHTSPQSHSQSIRYVAETVCNTTTGISEAHAIKKEAFHYRLRVIISTIILLEGGSQSHAYAYMIPPPCSLFPLMPLYLPASGSCLYVLLAADNQSLHCTLCN